MFADRTITREAQEDALRRLAAARHAREVIGAALERQAVEDARAAAVPEANIAEALGVHRNTLAYRYGAVGRGGGRGVLLADVAARRQVFAVPSPRPAS